MHWNDVGNGIFETGGAWFTWMNFIKLRQDRVIKGVYWPATVFFTIWGLWNLVYYPSLGQWFSFVGGAVLVAGNVAWSAYAFWLWAITPVERSFKDSRP